jgi:hypothetical protein
MARNDTAESSGLRDIYGFREGFDVALAAAFEPDVEPGCRERFGFYDEVGRVVERLGKRPFLPHRHVDLEWSPEKIVGIVNGIVIPTSDIVVAYLGVNSGAGGIMIGRAFQARVPVSYLYERSVGLDDLRCGIIGVDPLTGQSRVRISESGFKGDVYDLIEFEGDEEGLQKLELSLKRFYERAGN